LDARTRIARRWLIAAYLLAAVVAPCAHRHGTDAEDAEARCLASCQDSRLHLSGHVSPDLDGPPSDCLACQFRAVPQIVPSPAPAPFDLHCSGSIDVSGPRSLRAISLLRLSCRAPPRVLS
jgi:hypothetical protein